MTQSTLQQISARSRWSRIQPVLKAALAWCNLLVFFFLVVAPSAAQESSTEPTAPKAKPEDVASIDAILKAVYDSISGPAGQKRDWDRFRSLFAPGARLIPTAPTSSGGARARVMSAEDYIVGASKFFETSGFFESEIARQTELFGNIA
ncbi:MAG TPA: hypothetical protein VLA37_10370, partial [Sphingomonadaceae bacterium]|nr:hypothetical protein [Sphingomonadaceae bacterium]